MTTWQVFEDLVFCRLKLWCVWWPNWKGFAGLATLASLTSRLVSVSGFLDTPEKISSISLCRFRLNYSISWHFDTTCPNSISVSNALYPFQDLIWLWTNFLIICCADPLRIAWNTEESSIAVSHLMWRNGRHIWGYQGWQIAIGEGDNRVCAYQDFVSNWTND